MMSLVITIIVVIILAMIFVPASSRMPDEANYANFAEEVKNLEEGVQQTRLNNAYKGDTEEKINAGFKKVALINAPNEFQSFDTTGVVVTGYVVDLEKIKYENTEFGHAYNEIPAEELPELEFRKDDVYVYDSTGLVYYVKGTHYQNEIIHRPFADSIDGITSSEDGPIISNILIESGELADGTKTSGKAKIIISAFPRYGGELTVMVRDLIAEKQPDGTFTTQVSRNGVYTVVASEENGGRTVTKINVTGIIETNTLPSNLSMIVNNGNPNVTTRMVDIVVRADGAKKMIIAKNNPLKPTSSDERWEDYQTNFRYDLGIEEGRITLYAWFKNEYSNVTDQIVKETIIYDRTPPSTEAPTVTVVGPRILVESNQKDNISPDSYLIEKTEYGYRVHDGNIATEEDYTWIPGAQVGIIGPLENGETYDILTRTEDEVGHKSTSLVVTQKINFDYEINFDLNGAIGSIETIYLEAGTSVVLPVVTVERLGYAFYGWSASTDTQPEDIGNIIKIGEEYMPTGNEVTKTLYAVWAPRTDMTYKVEHYVEKLGVMNEYVLKHTETFNDGKVGDLAYAIRKTEGDFAGYVENTSHSNRVGMAEVKGDGSTVLRLYYNRMKFNLIVNGENAETVGTATDIPYETEVTISATPNDGYIFDRWVIDGVESNSPDYAGFSGENAIREPNTKFKMLGRDVTLIARTKLEKYYIVYNLNGGEQSGVNPVEYDRSTPVFTLNNPTKKGYDFVGWTGTELSEPTVNVTIDPSKLTKLQDREYTAVFTPAADLLTITATPTEPTNGNVRAYVSGLYTYYGDLRAEYRVGTQGSWDMYASSILIEENTVVYARLLKDGVVIDEESLVIDNIDNEAPIITDISISSSWRISNKMMVDVMATDNMAIYGYAITSTPSTPALEKFTSKRTELTLEEGANYIWVRDTAGNITSERIFAWDISDRGDKTVFAIIRNEKELIIYGTGPTASYENDNVPYVDYKSNIEEIKIESNVSSIGSHVLSGMENARTISICASLQEFKENALTYTNNYENIVIASGNQNFKYENYTLYDFDKTEIYLHSRLDRAEEYTIPSTVQTVKNHAFYENDNLVEINVSSNPEIEFNAFENCSQLYQVIGTIGGTTIGNEAFMSCSNLHILELSDSLVSIGEGAFKYTHKIGILEIPKTVNVVGKVDNSIDGVFEEIGILSGNLYNKGIVRYYQSCDAMYEYAHKYNTEAYFEMIDDVAPEAISLQITSPVSGTYSQGEKITFTAQFSEAIQSATGIALPELKIKIGEGDVKTVDSATVNGDQIIYRYFIAVEDFGEIKLSSYSGTVYDLANNSASVRINSLGGSTINANTVAMLYNNDTVTYHSSLQKAIDAIVGSEGTVTLLKNTEENITIKSNTDVELNLNSKVLTNTSGNPAIVNNGSLEVYDGTIESGKTAILTANNSTMNIYNIGFEISEDNVTTITGELNSNVTISYSTMTGKSTLIDISGTLQLSESSLITENGPALVMRKNTTGNLINTTIKTNSDYGMNVLSNANVSVSSSLVESTTGTAINNEGLLEISASTTVKGATGINTLGEVEFRDGTIEGTDSNKSAVENSGMFNIFDGTIKSTAGIAVQNRTGKFFASETNIETTGTNKDAIRNATGATVEIVSGDVYSKDGYALVNSGTTTISDGAELTSDGTGVIDNKAFLSILYSTIISNGEISTAITNTGRYEDTNNVINVKGLVGIENKNTGVIKLYGTKLNVDNDVASATGILSSSTVGISANNIDVNVNASAGIATGIKLEENASFETEIATIVATSESGIGYGVYNYKGRLMAGVKGGTIRDDYPIINGSTYGYYSTNGMLNYYGGQFVGSLNNSIEGTITDKPENSFVVYNQNGNREYSQLKFDEWIPTDVKLEADKTEWTKETITLTGSAKDEGSGIVRYAITNSSDAPAESEWIIVEPSQNEFVTTKEIEEWDVFYLHVTDGTWNYVRSNDVETKYDSLAPEIVEVTSNSTEWVKGDIAIDVDFTDNASGVIGYEFSKTYHEPSTHGASYKTIDASREGTVTYTTNINETIHIYLYDQAGNVAYQEYEITQVDNTAPTVNVEFVEYGESSVKVKITVEDEDSGIASIIIDGVEKTLVEKNGEKYLIHEITKSGTTVVEVNDNVLNKTTENVETYSIVYDSVGGNGTMPTQIKLKDQGIEILENVFDKSGYTFIEWNTRSDYAGTAYQGGDLYVQNANATMYANWKDTNRPQINDVYVSPNWVAGNNLLFKIDATDNIAVTGYQITTTNTVPTSWNSTNEVAITLGSETYYVWVKDDNENYISTEIKVYDLSETTSPKTVVAILKDLESDGKYTLSIEGQGSTKDLTSAENKPWESQLTNITNIDVKSGVTGIGENILAELVNAKDIKIPATVTDIAINSFMHTNNYENLTVEGSNFKVTQGMLIDAENKNVYVASTKLTTGDIVLPTTIENIAPYAFENSTITSIYISQNIDIQEGTFKNAANLKDIICDTQIGGKSIGNSAFEGCTSLRYIKLSEELESIGSRAFYNATKLTNITIGKNVTTLLGNQIFTNIGINAGTDTGKGYVYYYESNTKMSSYAKSTITKDQATFIGIDDILPVVSDVVINDGAEITNDNDVNVKVTATDNKGVTEVFLTTDSSIDPNTTSVTWMPAAESYTYTLPETTGDYTIYVWVKDAEGNISEAPGSDSITLAVYDFELNTELDVIQYVDKTGKDYYEYKDKGYIIDNPDIDVEVIGIDSVNHEVVGDYNIDYKISYQGKYVETITKTVHVIENEWNTSETTYNNFKFVTHLSKPYAKIVGYTNNTNETTLTIPETVTYNGEEYKVIDVGNGVSSIATTDNTVQKIVLSKNIIAVSDYAFDSFKRVSSIDYDENLMTIGSYAFAGSTGIYPTFTIKENVREVKPAAFEGTVINEIIIESGVKAIGSKAFYTPRGTFNNKTLNIPATIDYIGLGAFAGYKANSIIVDSANAKYATIDNTVLTDKANTTIYQYALGNTRTEYVVPEGIKTIAGYAFAEADNLQKITLASTTATIGLEAFKNSDNLKVVENTANLTKIEREAFASTAIESFEISSGITSIEAKTFKNTKLTSIYIPSNVTQIAREAFASNTNLSYAVIGGNPTITGDVFVNSESLEYLIALDENRIITLTETLSMPSATTLYVTSKEIEAAYEGAENWSALGIYRIKCLAELIGDAEITTEDKEVYTEQGVKLLDETIPTGTGTSSDISELTVERVSNVNDEYAGQYQVTYYVKYNGNTEMTLVRIINVNDDEAPIISGITTSTIWTSGAELKLDVAATDNKDEILSYAVSSTSSVPSNGWTNDSTVTIIGEESFIHVKDKAGNVTTNLVKAWDISENSDKKVYAYLKEDGELVATGEGNTKGYDDSVTGIKLDTPWEADKSNITKLTIEEGVVSTGDYVFSGLENVGEISIPSTLGNGKDISTSTFAGTNNFTNITIANGNTALKLDGTYTLVDAESKIIYLHNRRDPSTTYAISSDKEIIAEGAFYKNNNLSSIDMNTLVDVKASAFEGCLNLSTVNGEIGNTTIGDAAFSGDINLKEIYISTTVTTLGKGIFTNVPGPVYYYASCPAMKEYATTYSDETLFILIDNVGPSDEMPTLKASSSTILAICNQEDADTNLIKVEYIMRAEGEEYDETKWQSLEYFTGLTAGQKYYVKTRATDEQNNTVVSREASITTKEVPAVIEILAVPASPTSGDVDVVVEWPITTMEDLYGSEWPEGTKITKQIGIQNPGESTPSWRDITDTNATFTHTATENGVIVFARLFDGKNTSQTKSLSVENIDRIAPTGSVVINDGAEEVLQNTVTLTLSAMDDRNDTGFGVKYYYASENSTLDLETAEWKSYNGAGGYTFEFTGETDDKTVYVWYQDAAGNISDVCSDDIFVITYNVRLEQDGEITYHMTLTEAIANVKEDATVASKITLLNNISQEAKYIIDSDKNIVIDMNGKDISYTSEGGFKLITNRGLLTIMNSKADTSESGIYAVANDGTVIGIHNYGYLEVTDVIVSAESPNGTSIGIKNQRGKETWATATLSKTHLTNFINEAEIFSLIFTDEGATTGTDVSEEQNGEILAWRDGLTTYVSVKEEGYNIKMPEDCYNFFTGYGPNYKYVQYFDVSVLDVSNVTDMSGMFNNAGWAYEESFEIIGLDSWNTSNVTNMGGIFGNAGNRAKDFDIGDLSGWDTSKVTDMSYMFSGAGANVSKWNVGNINTWNTSNVTDMSYMFNNAGYSSSEFEIDISSWNVSNVTNMSHMFWLTASCAGTFKLGDLSRWDVSSVESMDYMFSQAGTDAIIFDIGNIGSWDVSSVETMDYMFEMTGASDTTFNIGDLSNWNTSSLTSMEGMFSGVGASAATWTTGDFSGWNTSNVRYMRFVFRNCTNLTVLDLSNWDTSLVSSMQDMFSGCTKLKQVTLGENFAFVGTNGYLPAQTNDNIPGATGKWYNRATGSEHDPASVHQNVTAVATYVAVYNPYTITYNLNGGTLAEGTPLGYTEYFADIVIGEPTRLGYTFTGWTGSNGSTPSKTVRIPAGSTGNKEYTANWLANTYEVRYNANGGSGTMSNSSHVYGILKSLSGNTFIRDGYIFKGWSKTANGTKEYNDKAIVNNLTTVKDGIVDLYAVWSVASYNITIDCNGGTGVSHMSYTIETPTFTLDTPTRDGYRFTGWTGSNGSTPQTSITITQGSVGARSYTANWQLVTYVITYDLAGGTVSTPNAPAYTTESATFTLNNPTKVGVCFAGWTGSNGTTPEILVTIAKGSFGDKVYTANWKQHTDDNNDGRCDDCDKPVVNIEDFGPIESGDPDTDYEYDPDSDTISGIVPPEDGTPEVPPEIPKENLPELVEFTFGKFEASTNYVPGTYQNVEYETSVTTTKEPVDYWKINFSCWLVDENGNIIKPLEATIDEFDKEGYSKYVVYNANTGATRTISGVTADSLMIYSIIEESDDTLENAIYLAAYLNKASSTTDNHVGVWNGTSYNAGNYDSNIASVNNFTVTTTTKETKQVKVSDPSSTTEYVYLPVGTAQAVKGMTWETWLASEYNIIGLTEEDNIVIRDVNYNELQSTDTIQANASYSIAIEKLDPGLYDENNNQLADWDTLVNTYGLNLERDYGWYSSDDNYYQTTKGSLYYLLKNNSSLSNATKLIVGDGITKIGNSALADYFANRLRVVNLPDTVTTIGEHTLHYNLFLEEFNIPSGVTSIGAYTLFGCNYLKSEMFIPASVTSIGECALSDNSITAFVVDKNNPNYTSVDGVLYNKNKTTLVRYPGGKLDDYFIIPDSVTTIGAYSFYGCDSAFELTIPNSVTTIGEQAFYTAQGLKGDLVIPDSVTSMGGMAFYYCKGLTSVKISNSITTIPGMAFLACTDLKTVTLPNNLTEINIAAFGDCTSLTSIGPAGSGADLEIPTSVTTIAMQAFSGCSGLTKVIYPSQFTEIGMNTFSDCTGLTSIGPVGSGADFEIPTSVTTISMSAFEGCTGLTKITIPRNVTSIWYAFQGCTGLTSATFEYTSGWKVGFYPTTAVNVSNPTTNATYLKSTYANEYWSR